VVPVDHLVRGSKVKVMVTGVDPVAEREEEAEREEALGAEQEEALGANQALVLR
jgi:hypothetical protein